MQPTWKGTFCLRITKIFLPDQTESGIIVLVNAQEIKKLPPGPKAGLGIKLFQQRIRDAAGFFEAMHEQYGDAVYFRLLNRRFCVVYSPELIEQVLVTKRDSFHKGPAFKKTLIVHNPTTLTGDGDDHRRLRKLIQPCFKRKNLDEYAKIMIEATVKLQEDWKEGEAFDMTAVTRKLTLNIASPVFFGRDMHISSSLIEDVLYTLTWSMKLTMLPMASLIAKLPLRNNRFRKNTHEALDRLIYQMVDKARRDEKRVDLISSLVHATDEDGIERPLSYEEVRDETCIQILASHETSANAMAWCFFYLGLNPDVRVRMEQEIDEVLGGRIPSPEDYNDLLYTRAVLSETLRITPPTYVVGREAIEDCTIGDYFIPKGTIVQPFWRAPQRDEKYWPEPLKFKPERWLEKQSLERPKYAYVPFGGGTRNCIGMGFAKLQVVFALAVIGQRWRIDPVSKEFPEVRTLGFYAFKQGLPVTLTERKSFHT